jgi:hypothetical protein
MKAKRVSKPSLSVFRSILVIALVGALAWILFHPAAPPEESSAVVQRIDGSLAPDGRNRAHMLEAIREHSPAIARGDVSGVVFSGAVSPGDLLTSYLAAARYVRCAPICSLTAKGKAQHWIAQSLLGDLTQFTVPLAHLTVEAVTKIDNSTADRAADRAYVDFSYRVKPNKLAHAKLAWAGSRRFCGIDYTARWKGLHRGKATFTKHDARWTLVAATSTHGDSNPFGVACAMP